MSDKKKLAERREHCHALEDALVPLVSLVNDLERNWTPECADFWQETATALSALRKTTNTIPMLSSLKERLALAEAVVVAYGLYGNSSLREQQINQGTREALRAVVQAGQRAIQEDRASLDEAPSQQDSVRHDVKEPEEEEEASARKTNPNGRPALRLLHGGKLQSKGQEEVQG